MMLKYYWRFVLGLLAVPLLSNVACQPTVQEGSKGREAAEPTEGQGAPPVNVAGGWSSGAPSEGTEGLELLATFEGRITEQIGYGMTPSGAARADVYFDGRLKGKISGTMKGIDYVLIRENFTELNVRGVIETDDGALISVEITGFLIPDGEIRDQMVRFQTSSPRYQWLHETIVVGKGKNVGDELIVEYFSLS
jgi:hypothetical protein